MSLIEAGYYAAAEVYNELGSGHSEAVYEAAMAIELSLWDYDTLTILRQVPVPLKYKGFSIGVGYIDILVDDVIIELKAVAKLSNKDEQQVRKYLTATGLVNGLLINFGNGLEIVQVHPVDCYINDDPSFPNHKCGELTRQEGNYDQTISAAD